MMITNTGYNLEREFKPAIKIGTGDWFIEFSNDKSVTRLKKLANALNKARKDWYAWMDDKNKYEITKYPFAL